MAAAAHGCCIRLRLFGRIGDLYVMEPMGELFEQINPAGRDPKLVARELGELQKAMGWLEAYLTGDDHAVGSSLTLADCELVPVLFFFHQMGPMFGSVNPLQQFPKADAYYKGIAKEPAAEKVLAELDIALRRMTAG
ncbi:MAG: glutathione S-transferase domain-containing protein [Parvibaculum sp.]|nr:glutathione S-transferase domain-containing protein [Parvibaculum sp.]